METETINVDKIKSEIEELKTGILYAADDKEKKDMQEVLDILIKQLSETVAESGQPVLFEQNNNVPEIESLDNVEIEEIKSIQLSNNDYYLNNYCLISTIQTNV